MKADRHEEKLNHRSGRSRRYGRPFSVSSKTICVKDDLDPSARAPQYRRNARRCSKLFLRSLVTKRFDLSRSCSDRIEAQRLEASGSDETGTYNTQAASRSAGGVTSRARWKNISLTHALSFRVICTVALEKDLLSEIVSQQHCDDLESGKLDSVNLQSVPSDEAQHIGY